MIFYKDKELFEEEITNISITKKDITDLKSEADKHNMSLIDYIKSDIDSPVEDSSDSSNIDSSTTRYIIDSQEIETIKNNAKELQNKRSQS